MIGFLFAQHHGQQIGEKKWNRFPVCYIQFKV